MPASNLGVNMELLEPGDVVEVVYDEGTPHVKNGDIGVVTGHPHVPHQDEISVKFLFRDVHLQEFWFIQRLKKIGHINEI